MIQVTTHMRIMVALAPVDFRKRIDGLTAICRLNLLEDEFSGTLFLFRNKSSTCIRILTYDGNGFWLCEKRLSKGHFMWWPKKDDDAKLTIEMHHLQSLLVGGNPRAATSAPAWRELPKINND